LKRVRVFSKEVREGKEQIRDFGDRCNVFVFCEKSTGVAHFRAGSSNEPEFSLDRVASLFAMQCLVRGFNPDDFVVMVPAEKKVMGEIVARAKELLDEGRAVASPATLSPRQREVLHSVLCNRANKEIASKLNITVRTVKFHISSLLSKFGVENRTELARRAAGLLEPTIAPDRLAAHSDRTEDLDRLEPLPVGPSPLSTNLRLEHRSGGIAFRGRAATA
jgi:DNA-binding CsgD family transcriptional regulator